ncbi:MAG: acetyltransferase [Isosphaeraceae bacterium]|nr:acetyltransferase [Isosphaeraceae bacterium]
MRPLWIIGAGGHAKVVIDAARASGRFEVAGVLDDDPGRRGMCVLGIPIRGEASPEAVKRLGIGHAVIAVGSNCARADIARRLGGHVAWTSVVHPTAYLAEGVVVGEGSVICAGVILQPEVTVGRHAILNTASSVDHDCLVGDFTHIAPGARLAGNVRIGPGALLGIGSSVLPRCSVGAWATIGAGGVVTRDIPPGVTAIGVPARPVDLPPAGRPDRPPCD